MVISQDTTVGPVVLGGEELNATRRFSQVSGEMGTQFHRMRLKAIHSIQNAESPK